MDGVSHDVLSIHKLRPQRGLGPDLSGPGRNGTVPREVTANPSRPPERLGRWSWATDLGLADTCSLVASIMHHYVVEGDGPTAAGTCQYSFQVFTFSLSGTPRRGIHQSASRPSYRTTGEAPIRQSASRHPVKFRRPVGNAPNRCSGTCTIARQPVHCYQYIVSSSLRRFNLRSSPFLDCTVCAGTPVARGAAAPVALLGVKLGGLPSMSRGDFNRPGVGEG